eukprot:753884-Hanusia_phi.AAC.4
MAERRLNDLLMLSKSAREAKRRYDDEDHNDVDSIRKALASMKETEQEMFIREGMGSRELGIHVSSTLQIVEDGIAKKIRMLEEEEENDKDNKAFYRISILPLKRLKEEVYARKEGLKYGYQTGYALGLLPPLHPLRILSCRIVFNSKVEKFLIFCVLLSCVCILLDRPNMTRAEAVSLDTFTSLLNFIFILEFFLKVVGMNFVEYIKVSYNRLDFLVVVASMVEESFKMISYASSASSSNSPILRLLRVTKALRPLRFVAKVKGLKRMIDTIFTSSKSIAAAVFLSVLLSFIFALLGLQLFMGQLNACSDIMVFYEANCKGVDEAGEERIWKRLPTTFDWIGQSLVSVTTLSTGSNWYEHMVAGMDRSGYNTGPYRDKSPWNALFFVSAVSLMTFLFLPPRLVSLVTLAHHPS